MTSAKTLYILGAGGHGKVTAGCAKSMGEFAQIVFLDSQRDLGEKIGEWQVVGRPEDHLEYISDNSVFFVAIGNNAARKHWQETLEAADVKLATIIHPQSVIDENVIIGRGTLVVAGAVINGFTQIGRGCIVNTSASVDHDCRIGDFTHIAPGCHLAGTIEVGTLTFIGIGSVVIPNRNIGDNVVLGAGSTVINDIESNVVAVGSPARPIKHNNAE